MARLKDLPNELYLELMYQCRPQDLLALVTASSHVFRVFQRYRNSVVRQIRLHLSPVPRPPEACAIARLRLLEKQCKSTDEYEHRVRLAFSELTDSSPGFIRAWPSNLTMLATLGDVCDEVDVLVEKVRAERWGAMVSHARAPFWNLGYETEPVPSQLGMEEHYVLQEGFLGYELYCRLFYHGSRALHIGTWNEPRGSQTQYGYPQSQLETLRFANVPNFFPAIQYVHSMHRGNLFELLGEHWPLEADLELSDMESTPTLLHSPLREDHQPPMDDSHARLSDFNFDAEKFMRYLTSLGMQFAAELSQSPCPTRESLILSKLRDFATLGDGIRHPRHDFPQDHESPYVDNEWLEERHVEDHDVYQVRQDLYIGPWFQNWHRMVMYSEVRESPWDIIRRFDRNRSVTCAHKKWREDQLGGRSRW
ncbi:hypothetical protein PG991_011700 [Apiospora marii]|uniref:F-box domain-containing protein n=1 Tax=Apiospora marii TaxID=335849 RepID=A0ABR1REZ5_9PEZI